jgi:glycosyltransferase involved in cell wall biosynthesis
MKIAMVTHSFYPELGGLESYLLNLSRTLVKLGHEVVVVTTLKGSKNKIENIDGIKIYRTEYAYPVKSVAYIVAHNFTKYRGILNDCDVIDVHGHLFHTTIVTMLMKSLGLIKRPVVLTIHGSFVSYQNKILNFIEKLFEVTFGNFNMMNADKIIAVSKYVRKKVCKDSQKSVVIGDGINLKEFRSQKVNFRKEYKIPKNKKIILFIGRFYWHKG